jgi:3-methylfumaryl-CoA hydratase
MTNGPASVVRDLLDPGPVRRLAGLLDLQGADLDSPGAALPPFWHWLYFLEAAPQSALGPDGHPLSGIPSPPGPGYRRMFAGGRLTIRHPLRLGRPATRQLTVQRSQQKQGRAGTLTFVTTAAAIEQDGRLAISEEQDIVYLPGDARPAARTEAAPAGEPAGELLLTFAVDPVVLFRFSALTYNAHRIHYDRDFALADGHADIVVHGPLQALLMAEALRREGADLERRTLSYRLQAPAYGAQHLTVWRTAGQRLEVRSGDGRTTASAQIDGP